VSPSQLFITAEDLLVISIFRGRVADTGFYRWNKATSQVVSFTP
jgi:hypothetical protein